MVWILSHYQQAEIEKSQKAIFEQNSKNAIPRPLMESLVISHRKTMIGFSKQILENSFHRKIWAFCQVIHEILKFLSENIINHTSQHQAFHSYVKLRFQNFDSLFLIDSFEITCV